MAMSAFSGIVVRAGDRMPASAIRFAGRALQRLNARRVRSFYSTLVSPGDLVFDIGASVGDTSKVFVDLGARVVCVEPHPGSARRLRDRFRNTDRVAVVEAGLSDTEASMPLLVCSRHPSVSTFAPEFTEARRYNHRAWDDNIDVATMTLDQLIEEHGIPSFCKIDVEGHEAHVLGGLSAALPLLSFEITPDLHEVTETCVSCLGMVGSYEYNFARHHVYSFDSERWIARDQLLAALTSGSAVWWSGDVYARLRGRGEPTPGSSEEDHC